MENNSLIIRSSSAEFLIFERQKGEKGIEVRFEDGDLYNIPIDVDTIKEGYPKLCA